MISPIDVLNLFISSSCDAIIWGQIATFVTYMLAISGMSYLYLSYRSHETDMTVFNSMRVYALSGMNLVLAMSTFFLSSVSPALNLVSLLILVYVVLNVEIAFRLH